MLFWLSEAAEEEHPYKKVGACVWPCGSGEVMLLSLVIRLLLWGDVASAAAAADPAADLDCCEWYQSFSGLLLLLLLFFTRLKYSSSVSVCRFVPFFFFKPTRYFNDWRLPGIWIQKSVEMNFENFLLVIISIVTITSGKYFMWKILVFSFSVSLSHTHARTREQSQPIWRDAPHSTGWVTCLIVFSVSRWM